MDSETSHHKEKASGIIRLIKSLKSINEFLVSRNNVRHTSSKTNSVCVRLQNSFTRENSEYFLTS